MRRIPSCIRQKNQEKQRKAQLKEEANKKIQIIMQRNVPCISIELDRIYYINLERRKDRESHFLQQCRNANIDMKMVQKYVAIDGRTFTPTEEEESLFENCTFKESPYYKNIMANQLSHFYILKEMMRSDFQNILILQDDVVFKQDFNKHLNNILKYFPEDAEIVNIGLHKVAAFDYFEPIELEDENENQTPCHTTINKYICEIEDPVNPCSLSYIVTRQGCQNLIQYFEEEGFIYPTDLNYNKYLQERHINYASSTILCTGALLGSDVWTCKEEVDVWTCKEEVDVSTCEEELDVLTGKE